MRPLALALPLLLLAPLARAGNPEFAQLISDPARKAKVANGIKSLKSYFKLAADVERGKVKRVARRDAAMRAFMTWLDHTPETLGMDLRGKPALVVEMFDRARVDTLVKGPRGKIEYVRVPNPRGMQRFEYAVLVPSNYTPKNDERYPLVLSLHERVINFKHPAFRGNKDPTQRSRVVVHNGWLKTPAADEAVIIAPTGNPNGFQFKKEPAKDLKIVYRAMGAGLTNYRVDWERIFLEVHGEALRVCCEQALMFAGFILRDREGTSQLPVPPEEFFMFENLNGTPLLYIADEDSRKWKRIGKPLSEALAAAYAKAGQPQNFVLIKDRRDANGALKGDPQKILKFIRTHRRPWARKKVRWRFFRDSMKTPTPVTIGRANFLYDELPPLEAKAGSLAFEVKLEQWKDEKGQAHRYNLIDISITEAESLDVMLYDGLLNLDLPISVRVNGVLIHDKEAVRRDWGFFVNEVLPRRFFMLPIVGSLQCNFDPLPQFKQPAKKKAGGANEVEAGGKKAEAGTDGQGDGDSKGKKNG